jgi:hypothetical protein
MPESEMSKESIDYARLQEEHGGKFVALRGGEVVASGKTDAELVSIVEEKGLDGEDLVFEYVRAKGCFYAFSVPGPRDRDRARPPHRSHGPGITITSGAASA